MHLARVRGRREFGRYASDAETDLPTGGPVRRNDPTGVPKPDARRLRDYAGSCPRPVTYEIPSPLCGIHLRPTARPRQTPVSSRSVMNTTPAVPGICLTRITPAHLAREPSLACPTCAQVTRPLGLEHIAKEFHWVAFQGKAEHFDNRARTYSLLGMIGSGAFCSGARSGAFLASKSGRLTSSGSRLTDQSPSRRSTPTEQKASASAKIIRAGLESLDRSANLSKSGNPTVRATLTLVAQSSRNPLICRKPSRSPNAPDEPCSRVLSQLLKFTSGGKTSTLWSSASRTISAGA